MASARLGVRESSDMLAKTTSSMAQIDRKNRIVASSALRRPRRFSCNQRAARETNGRCVSWAQRYSCLCWNARMGKSAAWHLLYSNGPNPGRSHPLHQHAEVVVLVLQQTLVG